LRVPKSGIPAGFGHRSFALQNSIYPPAADSNGNSGIPAARPSGACRNTPGNKRRLAEICFRILPQSRMNYLALKLPREPASGFLGIRFFFEKSVVG
jgi:hypothetical protein